MGPSAGISLFSAILLVGAAQGLFLAVATFFGGKSPNRASAYLAGLMLAFVFELMFRFVIVTGYIAYLPDSLAAYWALDLVYGPLVYLYTRELTSIDSHGGSGRSLGHLVLPIAGMVFALALAFTFPGPSFIATLHDAAAHALAAAQGILAYGSMASMIGYLWACFQLLHRHVVNVTSNFSYLEKKSLRWLRDLLIILATLLALYVFYAMAELESPVLDQLYPLAIVIAVFAIGFLGIKQPAVFDRQIVEQYVRAETDAVERERSTDEKYSKSALSEMDARAIYREIEEIMHTEKMYQLNDLSLPMLSDRLGLPSHYVSQAINQGSGSNFFDFVNRKRIKFVTGRLENPEPTETWNILDLAMEAGFNSKTAFYKAFRNITGQTPKQYQASVTKST